MLVFGRLAGAGTRERRTQAPGPAMKRWRGLLPIAVAAGLAAALLGATDYGFDPEEELGLARLFQVRGAEAPPPGLALVRLDADSLTDLRGLPPERSQWPAPLRRCLERYPLLVDLPSVANLNRLPRSLQACVVDRLREAGAAVIVFDVAFPAEADREAGTGELGAAMQRHGAVVVREMTVRRSAGLGLDAGRRLEWVDIVTRNHPAIAVAAAGAAPFLLPQMPSSGVVRQFWVRHPGLADVLLLPGRAIVIAARPAMERLADRLARAPPATLTPDARRARLVDIALAAAAGGQLPADLSPDDRRLLEAVARVHGGSSYLYFNFFGPPGSLPSLGLSDLLAGVELATGPNGAVPLRNAVVFIGRADPKAPRDDDTFITAFDAPSGLRISGVELAATAYANLLYDRAVTALPDGARLTILFALTAAVTVAACVGTVGWGSLLAIGLTAAWVGLAIAAFLHDRIWLPVALPVLMLLPILLLAAVARYLAARRSIRNYLPRGLARRVLRGEPSAATVEVTVMFTDIVGFTAMSERLEVISPTAVQAFQDRHLALLAAAIQEHGGEILDFMGDGVMAAWGWPDPTPDHAARACRAALDIATALRLDNTWRSSRGEEPVRLRIGLHSGLAHGGDIGAEGQRRFALSGDVVNVTSRVEQLGKELCPDQPEAAILASADTVARAGGGFAFEPLGEFILRGRVRPQPIFRLRRVAVDRRQPVAAAAAVGVAFLVATAPVSAQEPCPSGTPLVARLVGAFGRVTVDGKLAVPRSTGVPVCDGSVVEVGPQARGTLLHLDGNTIARLEENSAIRLVASPEPGSGIVDLLRGALFFISQVRRTLTIRTESENAGIEGTEVLIRLGGAGEPAFDLRVYDGVVAVTPSGGVPTGQPVQRVATGERLVIGADRRARLERPVGADAVSLRTAAARELAWTLYYPPLFADPGDVPPPLAEASRQLAAGRVDEARATLRRIGSGSADAPLRDALLAVVAVAQGDPESGLTLAQAAVDRRPRAAAPLLARSYAEQALRQLDAAHASARAATAAEPDDAMAWARLAEVELMFGETRRSREAADRAVALRPMALVFVVQGFSRLAAFEAEAARGSFTAALDFDSQQPLAHLGMGLAQIRRSQMEAGTRSLETAAGLDPTQSLLRSYLGKAYFEARRDVAAATQYTIAKELDPKDPTPWLYDAIRKQLGNRPVEALRDLERSIELNDNRAPTRSTLLLDEDRAVRAVSLARIYDDLGFEQLGQLEASRSLAYDPWSSAAHRFLSDIYQGASRSEVARVSELMQSQLLQPLSPLPVQPSFAFTDLNIVAAQGPTRVALDEFGPLFLSDGVRFSGTGGVGTDDTLGGEGVVSGMFGRTAFSIGQFHYESDGFRSNNDIEHDIFTAFGQALLNDSLSVQVEYRSRDSDQGDRVLNFDPDAFEPLKREGIDQEIWRLGAVWRPRPGIGALVSGMTSDDEEVEKNGSSEDSLRFIERRDRHQIETQGFFTSGSHRFVAGLGLYETQIKEKDTIDFILDGGPLDDSLHSTTFTHQDAANGYAYYFLNLPNDVLLTLGLGVDHIEFDRYDDTSINPKLGVEWRPANWLTARAAAFRSAMRPLVADSTVEPTQVIGFSQLFDDFVGTRADQVAGSVEFRPFADISVVSWGVLRDISVPTTVGATTSRDVLIGDGNEHSLGAAAYWTVTDQLAVSAGVTTLHFEQTASDSDGTPTRLTTVEAPLAVRYFSPFGWFAGMTLTRIQQEVKYPSSPSRQNNAGETLLDGFVGYRLSQRRGLFTVEVNNLLDERFSYQDESFRTAELPNPIRLPTRSVLARLIFAY